jgi:hypothetical protein
MRTQRLIAYAFAACLVSSMAGTAMADDGSGSFNAFLKGKYRHSGSISCATGDTPESIGSGPLQHITFTGITFYDGHGTATVKEHGIVTSGIPSSFEDDCIGTYEVNSNGSIRRQSTCTGAGGSYKLSGISWKGQVGVEGSVVDLSAAELTVQKLEVPATSPTFIQYRICGGLETEVRIQP